jgi:hypothetical protein
MRLIKATHLLLLKVERLSVYAVAEAGFVFGTIVEDVT